MKAWGVALLLAPAVGLAQQTGEASLSRKHQFSVYLSTGATVYLSDARTQGGFGASVGVRDTLSGGWLVQADLSHLLLAGNVTLLRVGAGRQREGTYAPAVLLTLSGFFGDHLTFLTPRYPTPTSGPAVALGALVSPLRFLAGASHISVLELGVGVGTEGATVGLAYHLGLIEMGLSF